MTPNFDRVARLYRWGEYVALGAALWRCRTHHLARLAGRRHALMLGDGDGRFTARLLAVNPQLSVDAVDASAKMLRLLIGRCDGSRVRTHHCNALDFQPSAETDLVVAHFFFDCFDQGDLDALIAHVAAAVRPDALWLVSDFRVPDGAMHWPARIYIRSLYFAFRVLTGLRVTRLPDYATPLRDAGLRPIAIHRSLFGMLTTELWG